MSSILRMLDAWLGKLEYTLLALLTGTLTLILTTQVIKRYLFNDPLFWAEEVSVQILISTTFIGTSYLIHKGKMVRVDMLQSILRAPYTIWMNRLLDFLGLALMILMCVYATEWILRPEVRTDISPTTQLPRWYNYAVLVVCFYTMAFHLFIRLFSPAQERKV